MDDCSPDPCHHGRCVDGIASFSCACAPGYTGTRCESQVDECRSQPCRHGGKCLDLVDKYLCRCPPGTTGGLGWGRNGTSGGVRRVWEGCLWQGTVVTPLSCSSAGVNCEVNIDDCASNPCTFGICRDAINRYDCVCQPGFTGGQAVAMERGSVPLKGGVFLGWVVSLSLHSLISQGFPCSVRSLVGMRLSLCWRTVALEHRPGGSDEMGAFPSGARAVLGESENASM